MAHQGTMLTFPGKEVDEQIFVFVRRYPLAFLPTLALLVGVTLLGVVLVFFLGIGGVFTYSEQVLVGSAFLLFMLLFALIEFIDFYFDLHIVTDRRLVDIDQLKLFNRDVATLLLDDVQDVKAKTTGILATLFSFGDVTIQTAGTQPNFIFDDVRNPEQIAAIIIDLSDQSHRGVELAKRHPEGDIAAIIYDRTFPHTENHQNEVPMEV